MMNVLPGGWFGSLASVIKYISGLTGGSRLIPFCPLGKSSGILDVWGRVFAARVIGIAVEFAVFALA